MATPVQVYDSELVTEFREPAPDSTRNNWQSLPVELHLLIFEQLKSVEEVWSLACTSRRLWLAFLACGAQIIEEVLQVHTHPWIRRVMHLRFNLEADGKTSYRYKVLRHIDAHIDSSAPFERLTRNASQGLILRFVTQIRKIHAAAHVILDHCNDNLWSIADKLRPAAFEEEYPDLEDHIEYSYHEGDETRAIMALWMCELHSAIMVAASRNDPPWVKTMVDALPRESRSVFNFFRRTWWGPIQTIFYGARAIMASRGIQDQRYAIYSSLVSLLPSLPRGSLELSFHCERPLLDYSNTGHREQRKFWVTRQMCQKPLKSRFFSSIRAIGPEGDEVHRLLGQCYVQYGVFHWDNRRLMDMSLLPAEFNDRQDLFQYWKSLLPDSEIAALVDAQKDAKRGYWQQIRERRAQGIADPEPNDEEYFEYFDSDDDRTQAGDEDEE
ncbi:hypothetical protein NLG97_g6316 [Lecanicillium saksenae]|uniref:Uncharacterized protein n=1 Tax=Lecanicillium saksenae TaxID=468837 RepID=A0ACC1QT64_9HYPO|nr:hypothetical protein NLG97_g6316 [Lecanicillium saksenae]